jgi:hypothetical protein
MAFPSLTDLVRRFRELGATRLLCKRLAENDNSKQQIYLGGSLQVIQQLPYTNVRNEQGVKRETLKADLEFSWIDSHGHVARAPGAQLILYPKYPEVRLSGFLRGCPVAPSENMHPVPKSSRVGSGPDGRLLFLATTPANSILAYLSLPSETATQEFEQLLSHGELRAEGVFYEVPLLAAGDSRKVLLAKLHLVHAKGWHDSQRLRRDGVAIPYVAQNGGGYTLEALFGITPNGVSQPDFLGWELKAYASGRVTLMTPEPDTGYYGEHGVEAFVRRYGRALQNDVLYFTGMHRANEACAATGHTLVVRGFNILTNKIADVNGGIELVDSARHIAAGWSFRRLIEHWGRKHASAAYVKYEKRVVGTPQYRYLSPVLLGEGTDFTKYLAAVVSGSVVYDPGSKISDASTRPRVKARSQFRIPIPMLSTLYQMFERVPLR